jgi:hypothetical protein
MKTPFRLVPGVAVLSFLWATSARACPLCVSDTGQRVRAGIFNADFGYNLAMTLLPFPLFLGIIYLIHSGPPWPKPGSGRSIPGRTDDDEGHPSPPERIDHER